MSIQRTHLYTAHRELGAKMVEFGGFEMPIQYEGILREHHATRNATALFDTCHMGEFLIQGSSAVKTLERLVSCHVADMKTGKCRYGLLCAEDGGVLDDLILYREAEDRFMLVVNAGTQEQDFAWIESHKAPGTLLENRSQQTAKIDVQGPTSPSIMEAVIPGSVTHLGFFCFRHVSWQGEDLIVSRTGYTGERGYEVYLPLSCTLAFWEAALAQGASPAGLGARDTLRLEAGLPLYGHELRRDRHALTAGLARSIATDKEFIGSVALAKVEQPCQTRVGLLLEGRSSARQDDNVTLAGQPEQAVGTVTSGSFSPTLGTAIAMAIVDDAVSAVGTQLDIQSQRKTLTATVTNLPFIEGSVRA